LPPELGKAEPPLMPPCATLPRRARQLLCLSRDARRLAINVDRASAAQRLAASICRADKPQVTPNKPKQRLVQISVNVTQSPSEPNAHPGAPHNSDDQHRSFVSAAPQKAIGAIGSRTARARAQ